MYQLKTRFEKVMVAKPALSTYMAFAESIRDTGIKESTIRRWFYKLVDPDDYAETEVQAVLRHLVSLA